MKLQKVIMLYEQMRNPNTLNKERRIQMHFPVAFTPEKSNI